MNAIRPFTLDIPEADLADLAARLDRTRWPEAATVDDWTQGTPLAALGELVAYWRTGYDWRRCEARLNAVGQFVTEIDGLDIHFLHKPSSRSDAVPLLLTHGWPGSVVEFLGVIDELTEPAVADTQAFHVIAPSLPGYGMGGGTDRADLDRIDAEVGIPALDGAGRGLGRGSHDGDRATGPVRVQGHPPQHANRPSGTG